MSKISSKAKVGNTDDKLEVFRIIPILVVLAVVPLIVYMKLRNLQGIEASTWVSPTNMDFFSFYKAKWIHILATFSIAMVFYVVFIKREAIDKTIYFIPASIYLLFCILSTIFSKNFSVSLNGYVEKYEGMLTLISYVLLLVSAMLLVKSERGIKLVIYALLFSSIIIGFIGLGQYFGQDFFQTDIGKRLILPSAYEDYAQKLSFNFGKNRIYSTLYNPNYVGSYATIVFPLCLGLVYYFKNIYAKVASGLVGALMIFTLIGSESRAGLIGTALGLTVFLVMVRKRILKYKKISVIVVIGVLFIAVGMNIVSNGAVLAKIKSMNVDKDSTKITRIKQFSVSKEEMVVETEKAYLKLKLGKENLNFLNEKGEILVIQQQVNDRSKVTMEDKKYSEFSFEINPSMPYNVAHVGNSQFYFRISQEGFEAAGYKGQFVKPQNPEKWGFKDNETFASGRGYIWSVSLPLLKDTVLLGYGPDNYSIYVPQNDFLGKLNGLGTMNMLIDKPHNMYLQMGINTGVISLLAFLALIGIYIVDSFKLYYRKDFLSFKEIAGVAILVSVIGYCITGVFNDSIVSVSPIFWILLGVGIRSNLIIKKGL